ncbi:hypothetical protein PIB30_062259, partial [Stylosanthes scabra]|nr:hypothetical protein [Stylosanthes scabra]
ETPLENPTQKTPRKQSLYQPLTATHQQHLLQSSLCPRRGDNQQRVQGTTETALCEGLHDDYDYVMDHRRPPRIGGCVGGKGGGITSEREWRTGGMFG